jgi:hypothetical protein
MSLRLHRFFTDKLLIKVQENCLTISEGANDDLITLPYCSINDFVRRLYLNLIKKEECSVGFIECKKENIKFTFEKKEIILMPEEFFWFLQKLQFCIAHSLLFFAPPSYVGFINSFSHSLHKQLTSAEKQAFFEQLKNGNVQPIMQFLVEEGSEQIAVGCKHSEARALLDNKEHEEVAAFAFFHRSTLLSLCSLLEIIDQREKLLPPTK